MSGGENFSPRQIADRAVRFKEYFGEKGGITLSGGEPLLQAEFARELFEICKKEGINTCLDTSGNILTDKVKLLLDFTERVLLDIKFTTDELYRQNVGCGIDSVLEFLDYLNRKSIPTTIRQVIIPRVNDSKENVRKLKKIADAHTCVDGIELLPFKKLCRTKYDLLNIPFPFGHLPEPDKEKMRMLNEILS